MCIFIRRCIENRRRVVQPRYLYTNVRRSFVEPTMGWFRALICEKKRTYSYNSSNILLFLIDDNCEGKTVIVERIEKTRPFYCWLNRTQNCLFVFISRRTTNKCIYIRICWCEKSKLSVSQMEICNSMDNMSQQYYAGMQSDQSEDFAPYEQQFDDQSNYDYAQPDGIVCDNNSSSENWLSDGIKCKREIDLTDISQPSSSTSNFDTTSTVLECDYNDANCSRVHYEHYDPSMKYMNDGNSNLVTSFVKPMPPTHHLQQQRPHHRSYHHVTSVNSHNQLPNWYNAPVHYEAPPPAPFHPAYPSHFRDTYLQQHPHHADVNMRNMMSMSNRYLCNVDEQKKLSFRFSFTESWSNSAFQAEVNCLSKQVGVSCCRRLTLCVYACTSRVEMIRIFIWILPSPRVGTTLSWQKNKGQRQKKRKNNFSFRVDITARPFYPSDEKKTKCRKQHNMPNITYVPWILLNFFSFSVSHISLAASCLVIRFLFFASAFSIRFRLRNMKKEEWQRAKSKSIWQRVRGELILVFNIRFYSYSYRRWYASTLASVEITPSRFDKLYPLVIQFSKVMEVQSFHSMATLWTGALRCSMNRRRCDVM